MKTPKVIEASKTAKNNEFNAQAFLDSAGLARKIKEYRKAETIFSQGDPCKSVMYVQRGEVRLSVVSKTGKEAVVAILGSGDFVGEGALAAAGTHGDSDRSHARHSARDRH
jgi:CRP/FNR family transcriptional regulator, cyclic AMP receptor protein